MIQELQGNQSAQSSRRPSKEQSKGDMVVQELVLYTHRAQGWGLASSPSATSVSVASPTQNASSAMMSSPVSASSSVAAAAASSPTPAHHAVISLLRLDKSCLYPQPVLCTFCLALPAACHQNQPRLPQPPLGSSMRCVKVYSQWSNRDHPPKELVLLLVGGNPEVDVK